MGLRPFGRRRLIFPIVGGVLLAGAIGLVGCAAMTERPTDTVKDTGVSTTSTTVMSLPALPSGITADQVRELLAGYSGVPAGQWEVRDYRTLSEWAAATVYTSELSNQMTPAGTGVVFRQKKGAWLYQGSVEPYDLQQAKIALDNMGASEEVRTYFAEVANAAPEDVFTVELHKQATLFGQTLDDCRGQDSLQYIDDISRQLATIHANLSGMEAPTERTSQVAGQLLRLVERLKGAADKAEAGLFSQTEFDRDVLLVTDHLPLATDNIGRLLAGLDVTTTTASH